MECYNIYVYTKKSFLRESSKYFWKQILFLFLYMINIQNLLWLIFEKIGETRLDGLVPDNSLSHFVISTQTLIHILDAAYKAREYNVQSLIRLEIVWNG